MRDDHSLFSVNATESERWLMRLRGRARFSTRLAAVGASALACVPSCFAPRPQVLGTLALSLLLSAASAQPPQRAGDVIEVPLVSMTPEEFVVRYGDATRLKLKLDNAPASDIAAELSRQLGIPVRLNDNFLRSPQRAAMRYSVAADGETVWQAMRNWTRDPEPLTLYHNSHEEWELYPGDPPRGVAAQAGPVELLATGASITRLRSTLFNPLFTRHEASDTLSIATSTRWEPRMQSLFSAMIIEVQSAVDDQDRPLKPSAEVFTSLWDSYHYHAELPLVLSAPAPDAKRLKSLRGQLRVSVVFRSAKWEIDPKATPRAEKSWPDSDGEVRYIFDGLSNENQSWLANFHIARSTNGVRHVFKGSKPLNERMTTDMAELLASVHFFDLQGNELPGGGGGMTPELPEGNTRKLRFSVAVPGDKATLQSRLAKIVVDVPLEWREVHFPFEFRDLPLPPP